MTKGTVPLTFDISDEDLLDSVIDMAGYGIGYWADKAEVDEDARTYTVTFDDGERPFTKALTFDWIVESMGRYAAQPFYSAQYVRDAILENDWGHIDADAADGIIQWALFGELVYG